MVRKLLTVGIIASAMTTALAGAALAAPAAMTLSSFEPTTTDGVIDGGARTISVTNLDDKTLQRHTIELGQAPCECVVTAVTSGTGVITDGTWLVGDLGPGETATVSFSYGQPIATGDSAAVPYDRMVIEPGLIGMILIALLTVAASAGIYHRLVRRPNLPAA